jgi:hypothetical protein
MILIYIVLALVALISFFEYKHLSNNHIRFDEHKYAIISWLCLLAIIILLVIKNNPF